MVQFMEHRLRRILICGCLLFFINMAEMYILEGYAKDVFGEQEEYDRITEFEQANVELKRKWYDGEMTLYDYREELYQLRQEYSDVYDESPSGGGGTDFFKLFTITIPDAPKEINAFLSIINLVLIVIFSVIALSFAYDIVKALPLT